MAYRILLTGASTGGHAFPLLAVAQELRELAKQRGRTVELMVMGDGPFAKQIASELGVRFKHVFSGKLRRYSSFENFTDFLKMPFGLIQSLWYMYWFMPDLIFSKGGYDSVLPVSAGRFFLIPIIMHETDSIPGLANSIIAKRATRILLSFESTAGYFRGKKVDVVGNPVREELFHENKEEALSFFKFSSSRKTVFVIGGSQGAKALNDVLVASVVKMSQSYQVIHQAGQNNYEYVKSETDKIIKEGASSYGQSVSDNYRVFPFLSGKELALAYAAADLVVSRAGGSIFEIAMAGKPVILVPIPNSANDHQLNNALEMAKYGAIVLEQENLSEAVLLKEIETVFKPENYQILCDKIKSFTKSGAAKRVAAILLGDK